MNNSFHILDVLNGIKRGGERYNILIRWLYYDEKAIQGVADDNPCSLSDFRCKTLDLQLFERLCDYFIQRDWVECVRAMLDFFVYDIYINQYLRDGSYLTCKLLRSYFDYIGRSIVVFGSCSNLTESKLLFTSLLHDCAKVPAEKSIVLTDNAFDYQDKQSSILPYINTSNGHVSTIVLVLFDSIIAAINKRLESCYVSTKRQFHENIQTDRAGKINMYDPSWLTKTIYGIDSPMRSPSATHEHIHPPRPYVVRPYTFEKSTQRKGQSFSHSTGSLSIL